jgi:type I restriction enzyme R subunit
MMGLIDDTRDGLRRFGVGHFDLVVIDEAHRSVFQKYKAIFEYFDSLLIGLTATPKGEVDRNTYDLFDLETGVPTDAYALEDAVKDKFLVPPCSVSVQVKFPREGIKYDDLSEEEKEQWDETDWGDETGEVPDRVEAPAVNKWLFNKDTVDKVLELLMTRGLKVAGGDRLGKTILFAKNEEHARFIADRFNVNYPHFKGHFAQVITFKTEYAQSLIDNFSIKEKPPHIAISVDMLDTGIDVPEVVNLVFFKLVRSKTKFWQMIGRGTRLCPDLFGPGQHKTYFFLFDYCGNLEFFSVNPDATEGSVAESLGKRLFKTRLELVSTLDQLDAGMRPANLVKSEADLRHETAETLRQEVAAMNPENFVVRPKRRLVEKYAKEEAWKQLSDESRGELAKEVAGLPAELDAEPEEAKRFDLLMLRLQLAVLRSEPAYERLQKQVKEIAGLLEEKSSIPMVQAEMLLILDLQSDEWWQDVTTPMLENARKRIRNLVQFIEKSYRGPVFTNFEDELGDEAKVELPGLVGAGDFELFREKARLFLKQHQDHPAVRKLRTNQQLTATDLSELETILASNGGKKDQIEKAKAKANGLGVFVRSLVDLDRDAAKQAFSSFLTGKMFNSKQIEFVDMIINHLAERGVMEVSLLYDSPFVDIAPQGPDGLFTATQVQALIKAVELVRTTALAA